MRDGRGFTLVEIMIAVAILGVLASIAMANFVKARANAQCKACIANLKQIDNAKVQWAIETKQPDTAVPVAANISPYFRSSQMPACPANGTYKLRRLSKNPTCNLSRIGHNINNVNMDEDPAPD